MIDVIKMSVFLFVICSVSAAALALTNMVTAEKRAENRRKIAEEARAAVIGDLVYARIASREKELDGAKLVIFDYFDENDRPVAFVVKGAGKGFGGKFEFMLGVHPDGRIMGVSVMAGHGETPGLGTKVTHASWLSGLRGLMREEVVLTKDDRKGKVDAVTGVTITSRAVTRGVSELLGKLEDEFGK